MSDIKTRKFKCTGCGESRPCYLQTNQETQNGIFVDIIEDLKCVLDETNQTSYNWIELDGVCGWDIICARKNNDGSCRSNCKYDTRK